MLGATCHFSKNDPLEVQDLQFLRSKRGIGKVKCLAVLRPSSGVATW